MHPWYISIGTPGIGRSLSRVQLRIDQLEDEQGFARTQSPTNKNYALELPTFGVIAGVNPIEVQ